MSKSRRKKVGPLIAEAGDRIPFRSGDLSRQCGLTSAHTEVRRALCPPPHRPFAGHRGVAPQGP